MFLHGSMQLRSGIKNFLLHAPIIAGLVIKSLPNPSSCVFFFQTIICGVLSIPVVWLLMALYWNGKQQVGIQDPYSKAHAQEISHKLH